MAALSVALLLSCSQKNEEQGVTIFDAEAFTAEVDGKVTSLYTLKADRKSTRLNSSHSA